jgi:hypothetical protein
MAQARRARRRCSARVADRVFGSSQKAADFQGLLDPSEEQLDGPSSLVKIGDFLCSRGQIIGEDAQHFAGLEPDLDLAGRAPFAAVIRCTADPRAATWLAQCRGMRRRHFKKPRPTEVFMA